MCARRNSGRNRWIFLGVILLAAGAAAVLFLRPSPLLYESMVAESGDITAYYSFSGNVETKNRHTEVSGKYMQIADIKVKEGQKVNKGMVLMATTAKEEIKAEIAGEIAKLYVEENAQVMAGTPLLDIVDYESLRVQVKVDEYDLNAFTKGKEAKVIIGALDQEFTGKISEVAKEGQHAGGITYFPAMVDIPKATGIRVGMSAEVRMISNQAKGVVTLPMSVIQFDEQNKPFIYKEDDKGTVVKTGITTGINDGMIVEVKSGIVSGETIFYKKTAGGQGLTFTRSGSTNNRPSRNHPGFGNPESLSGSLTETGDE